MQNKPKKNLYGIIFLVIMLSFIITLTGCDWFSNGLFNIFDPKAQIIVELNPEEGGEPAEGCCNAGASCINGVEFFITGFAYNYHGIDSVYGKIEITALSRVLEASFYVAPSISPGTPGPKTIIENIPLFFQDVIDYLYLHPFITEITCDLSLVGVDGAGHSLSFQVASELPIFQPGIDLYPPSAVIIVAPSSSGYAPFTVAFDASGSFDVGSGIASYGWDFGDGNIGTGELISHTYANSGTYVAKLTVTDLYGNSGTATIVIIVSEVGGPNADIQLTPGATGAAPFTVAFDGSGSTVSVESGSGCSIVSYNWNFGDDSTGTGIITTHTYNSEGLYPVILAVTDSNGKAGYATAVITVTEGPGPGPSPEVGNIIVSANPESNVPGGTSTITAVVTDTEGQFVADGTTVYFLTNNGALSTGSATTTNGMATVTLTLSGMQVGDTATVTAFIGAVTGSIGVTCTSEAGTSIGNIIVSANPESNVPGGTSTITAVVTDTEGQFVADGTTVYFLTNNGALSTGSATTTNGMATVTLTLSGMQVGDTATVTAFIGAVTGSIGVTCTSEAGTSIGNITVYANPESNVPGGVSTITAIVTNTEGDAVPNDTTVYFHTNSGTLSPDSANTTNGIATTNLTLNVDMQNGAEATVTAFIGSKSAIVKVTCVEESVLESITLSANPISNVPGGISIITAIVKKEDGSFVENGTTVYFTTNSGLLSAGPFTTTDGVATVELTLDDNMEAGANAKVTAFTVNSEDAYVTVTCIDIIITIYAEDYTIAQAGNTTITAVVTDTTGDPVEEGIIVIFYSKDKDGDDIGTLNPVYAPTASGIASTILTLGTIGDIATVNAKCGSRVSNTIVVTRDVIFTISADDYIIVPVTGISKITAVVTEIDGEFVIGETVFFFAKNDTGDDIGTLTPISDTTDVIGIAETDLTGLDTGDVVTVTAKCGSRVSNEIIITTE